MTKGGFYCILLIMAATIGTSCLSESGQKVNLGNYPGVADKRGDSLFFYLKGKNRVYSPVGGANVDQGDCVIVDFTLDYGMSENADSGKIKGYLTVNITKMSPVPLHELSDAPADTSAALPNEQTITSVQQQNAFILNRFFLFTQHKTELPLHFELSYDPQQITTDKVYDLFLRVASLADEAPSVQPATQYNAFNLEELSHKETDSLFFRINYIQSFNKDSTLLIWATTPVYRFAL
jgi:hypothetical protein